MKNKQTPKKKAVKKKKNTRGGECVSAGSVWGQCANDGDNDFCRTLIIK
jgi:hypothetical protein